MRWRDAAWWVGAAVGYVVLLAVVAGCFWAAARGLGPG